MLYFVLGVIVGFVFAVLCVSRLVVGNLARVQDEDGVYPYMVLKDPNVDNVFKKKFVVLQVGNPQE